jgi:hypothetical protein
MSTVSTCFCDPQFSFACLERLAIDRPSEMGSEVWAEVHEEIQRVLQTLEEPVRSRVKHLRTAAGATRGRNFHLFTYRTFSRTDATDIDPVVVGLTFAEADEEGKQVVIDADISGESTGDGIKTFASRTVLALRNELLRASNELARELSRHGPQIAEALLDSSRSI